jgi:RNA polymerase sigma-70 factor (ECF subfamily)
MLQISEDWLAGYLVVSVDCLADYEAGRARLTANQLTQLATALDVAERFFFLGYSGRADETVRKALWLREVDRWFASQVFPHERDLLYAARAITGDADKAQDVLHEAYAELLSGERWRALAHPRAYAMKVVRTTAIRSVREMKVVSMEGLVGIEAIKHDDDGRTAYDLVSAKEQRQRILDAIESLPPQCSRVVKLRRLQEKLPREIAAELNISVSAVEKLLARGMVALAAKLGGSSENY